MSDLSPTSSGNGPPDDESTAVLWANARAITFRLLGDTSLSERAARDAVAQTVALGPAGPGSWAQDPRWMTVLAVVAVERSLVLDVVGDGDHPDLAPRRRELRRRLALVEPAQWAAPVVHHLAGYPAADTARLLGRDAVTVRAEAALFDPTWDYRELGQAQTAARPRAVAPAPATGPTPPPSSPPGAPPVDDTAGPRRGRRRWSLSGSAVVVVLALVGGGITVTTLFPGQRASTVGPARTVDAQHVGPDVPPLPSAGCARPDSFAGVSAPQVVVGDRARPYRLAVPQVAVPVGGAQRPLPLLLAVPGGGQTADEFARASGLENAAGDTAAVATLEPVPPFLAVNVEQDTRRPDDLSAALAVVGQVVAEHCIDQRRIHVVGDGLGGQLAGALGCTRPGTFASVVAVGGSFRPEPCLLDPPVSLLEVPRPGSRLPGPGGTPPATDVAAGWARAISTDRGPLTHSGPGTSTVTDRTGGRWGSFVRTMTVGPFRGPWPRVVADQVVAFTTAAARAT